MPVQHFDNTGGRGPSPAIFANFANDIWKDWNEGIRVAHDFTSFNGTVAANVGTYASDGGGIKTFESTSSNLRGKNSINSVAYPGGIICASADATADHVVSSEFGDGQNLAPFLPKVNSGSRIGFECRVLFEQLTTQDAFFGLTVPGKATSTGIFNQDALQAISLMGFWVLAGTPTIVNCGYGLSSAALTTISGTLQTLAQYTWYKLGFLLTPAPAANLLQIFVNGAEQASFRQANVASDANFPTGIAFTPNLTAKTAHAGTPAMAVDYDWVVCYQDAP